MSLPSPIRIVVIDPLPLIAEGLAALLNQTAGFSARSCPPAPSAIDEALHSQTPDVVLLGVDQLDGAAASVLDLFRAVGIRSLLLTGSRDPALHARAIDLGANGVMTRDLSVAQLCEAIRAVCAGDVWLEQQCAPAVLGCLVRRQGSRDLETVRIESLTRREREVVMLITEGLRNKQIADRLFISEATVRNHVTSILSKLELSDRFDLAVYAFRRGMTKASDTRHDPLGLRSHPNRDLAHK